MFDQYKEPILYLGHIIQPIRREKPLYLVYDRNDRARDKVLVFDLIINAKDEVEYMVNNGLTIEQEIERYESEAI